MAAASCCLMASNGLLSLSSFPLSNSKSHAPISFFPFNYRLKSKFDSVSVKLKPPRLDISQKVKTPSEHLFQLPIVSCLVDDESGVLPESGHPSTSSDQSKFGNQPILDNQMWDEAEKMDAVIDIKLPRRSLLITFTCNACGVRSQKFVNRLAYERGTVFVQCSGCFRHHKLVDNLGLIVEYNFQEEANVDPDTNQQ